MVSSNTTEKRAITCFMENPRNSHSTKQLWDCLQYCICHSHSQCVTLKILPLHCENECLVVVSSRSHPPGWEKEETQASVRLEGGRDSTAVSSTTPPHIQCPVSCADPAMRFWARHCATRCAPSKRNISRVPFSRTRGGGGIRCLAAWWWRRLRCCSVIKDARQKRCCVGWARPSAAIVPTSPTRPRPHPQQQTRKKKKSSTPCHFLVRDGSAFQSNTATRRSAFPQKMRATAPSQCIFLFHFRGMQQLPAPSTREASSCTATCTPCGCVSADTQIKKEPRM
ncbi:hypothetical protein TCDM_13545 [Trypanosoma cruzi Dm28c]|uniref:Uncharacterized protein n=1 Tax=Trypanosoma cruzi Dm28c TaxID=1416333 RepID=V5CI18_TRYCR|nr:hypothetical protein TCDM_13545 [Trypanosoma cruzi Dm28c]